MKFTLKRFWPWKRIAELESQLADAKATSEFAMKAHSKMYEQFSELQDKHDELTKQHSASRDGLRKMAEIFARRGFDKIAILMAFLFSSTFLFGQPIQRQLFTTNPPPSLSAAAGPMVSTNGSGLPVLSYNGGALTNAVTLNSTLVDSVYGSDVTGKTNDWGHPFLTITNAVAQMQGYGTMTLMPGEVFDVGTNTILVTNMTIVAWGARITRESTNTFTIPGVTSPYVALVWVYQNLNMFGGTLDSSACFITNRTVNLTGLSPAVGNTCTNIYLLGTTIINPLYCVNIYKCTNLNFTMTDCQTFCSWASLGVYNSSNCVFTLNNDINSVVWRTHIGLDATQGSSENIFCQNNAGLKFSLLGGKCYLEQNNPANPSTSACCLTDSNGTNDLWDISGTAINAVSTNSTLVGGNVTLTTLLFDPGGLANIYGHITDDLLAFNLQQNQNVNFVGDQGLTEPELGILGGQVFYTLDSNGHRSWTTNFFIPTNSPVVGGAIIGVASDGETIWGNPKSATNLLNMPKYTVAGNNTASTANSLAIPMSQVATFPSATNSLQLAPAMISTNFLLVSATAINLTNAINSTAGYLFSADVEFSNSAASTWTGRFDPAWIARGWLATNIGTGVLGFNGVTVAAGKEAFLHVEARGINETNYWISY